MTTGLRWSEDQIKAYQSGKDAAKKPLANKYHAVKTGEYDSKREAARGLQLQLLEKAKKIFGLEHHTVFPLSVNGQHICNYEADFIYQDEACKTVVEDVKGVRTDLYKLKKKLMKAIYNIDIVEV